MLRGIRLRNEGRIYDCLIRLKVGVRRVRLAHAGSTVRMLPYTGAKRHRRIRIDDIACPGFGKRLPKNVTHHMNGSKVVLFYDACHKATRTQIKKAAYTVDTLKTDPHQLSGTLIDVFEHEGSTFMLLGGVMERDREKNRHKKNFRVLNLDEGCVYSLYLEDFPPTRAKKTGRTRLTRRAKKKTLI